MFHINKQMAIDKAKGEWVLLLDADERITNELRDEIKNKILNIKNTNQKSKIKKEEISGFWIPRKNIIFGKWIKYTGWRPDYQLRLFKKGKAKLLCQSVHEHPILKGKSGKLKNPLVHHHYQTISQFLKRLDLYTDNDKNIFLKEKKKLSGRVLLLCPLMNLLKDLLPGRGIKMVFMAWF